MIAIIIPYYKLTFFEETLQSLANQTDKRFKVYIGDDASPEGCSSLLEQFKGKFDFRYHRFEINLGGTSLTQQWERCIALSENEEWIMILGDDDVLGENVVEEFYKQYDSFVGRTNLIRYATKVIDHKKGEVSKAFLHPKWENAGSSCYRKSKGFSRSSLSEYVFKRQMYLKFKFRNYPLAWHSDDMAWIEFANSRPIYSINEATITIGVSTQSLSGMKDNLEKKYQASLLFYRDVIFEKLHLFNKKQSLELLIRYEVLIKKTRKLLFDEWLVLFQWYFKKFSLIPFLKLHRRIVISIFS